MSEEKVYMQLSPDHYEGDFPSVTIHYRDQDKYKAERLKQKIEELMMDGFDDEEYEEYKNEAEKFCFRYGVMIGELRKKAKGEK